MTLQDLPPLREALAAGGLSARKSFGQHFLLDLNITRKIVRLAEVPAGETIIEIGPGPGGLTRALLEGDSGQIIVVEKDPRFLGILQTLAQAAGGRLIVVQGDGLEVDEAQLVGCHAQGSHAHIVSNLPYNVGAPLLVKWLTGRFRPASMTLMFQKEVAQRLAAGPGENAYGRLSVLAQAVAQTRIVMSLPARAFTPAPKVESAVVRLVPRSDGPDRCRLARLEAVTGAAFGQRRKMLRSSLRALGGETLCAAAGVNDRLRAEDLSVDSFLALADAATTPTPSSQADDDVGEEGGDQQLSSRSLSQEVLHQ